MRGCRSVANRASQLTHRARLMLMFRNLRSVHNLQSLPTSAISLQLLMPNGEHHLIHQPPCWGACSASTGTLTLCASGSESSLMADHRVMCEAMLIVVRSSIVGCDPDSLFWLWALDQLGRSLHGRLAKLERGMI